MRRLYVSLCSILCFGFLAKNMAGNYPEVSFQVSCFVAKKTARKCPDVSFKTFCSSQIVSRFVTHPSSIIQTHKGTCKPDLLVYVQLTKGSAGDINPII